MLPKIGIIGLGWLGTELAKHLAGLGYEIHGSRTRFRNNDSAHFPERIKIYFGSVREDSVDSELIALIDKVDQLVVNIPPSNTEGEGIYERQIESMCSIFAKAKQLRKIIFISSTGVFPDVNPFVSYDEEHAVELKTERQSTLLKAENLILNLSVKSVVVRCGGLVGGDRHPVRYLSGKLLKNPDAPVNITRRVPLLYTIHRLIIEKNSPNLIHAVSRTLNGTFENRNSYYSTAAKLNRLPLPIIDSHATQEGKHIVSRYDYEA